MSMNGHFDPQSYTAVLARLDTQLSSLVAKIDKFMEISQAHEKRISALERWQSKLIGIGVIVGIVAGYTLPRIFDHVYKP